MIYDTASDSESISDTISDIISYLKYLISCLITNLISYWVTQEEVHLFWGSQGYNGCLQHS